MARSINGGTNIFLTHQAPPSPATVASVTDDVSPIIGTLTSGGYTNDPNLTVAVSVAGTGAVASDTVQLYDGTDTGNPLGTAHKLSTGDLTGSFDIQTGALTDGPHTITARISDQAGNQSLVSTNLFAVTEDTATPAAPAITSIGGADHEVSTQTGDKAVVGTAEVGSTVTLTFGATTLGSVVATGGTLSYLLTTANLATIGEGSGKRIIATAKDVAGNASTLTASSLFGVDTVAPSAPAITAIGGADHEVSTQTGDQAVVGTAETGSIVTLTFNRTTLGSVAVPGGSWSYRLTTANLATIGEGSGKTVIATAKDTAGNTSTPTTSSPNGVDTTAPGAPTTLTLASGSDSGTKGDDITNVALPTFTGTGENRATVTLFDGATAIGTGPVTNGTWSITATVALSEGANSITAAEMDGAGNFSATSAPLRSRWTPRIRW